VSGGLGAGAVEDGSRFGPCRRKNLLCLAFGLRAVVLRLLLSQAQDARNPLAEVPQRRPTTSRWFYRPVRGRLGRREVEAEAG
jgi:hypothetical protein